MTVRRGLRSGVLGGALFGMAVAAMAAPPASNASRDTHAALQKVNAEVAAARTRHAALQQKVVQMERQDSAQRRQLEQRDAEIAALQRKLHAAGVPASAASRGH